MLVDRSRGYWGVGDELVITPIKIWKTYTVCGRRFENKGRY